VIDVMVWVLNRSEAKHGDRLVLLALAEYAHKDGSKAFPKIEELAHRTKLSERQVTNSLKYLRAHGAIRLDGTTRGGVKVWTVLMSAEAARLVKGGADISGEESGNQGCRIQHQGVQILHPH
jgi:hypothetical protein